PTPEGAPAPEGEAEESPGDAEPSEPAKKKKKKKKKKTSEDGDSDAAASDDGEAPAPTTKKKKKKKKKKKEKHKVNQGTEYRLGLFPGSYVQDPLYSVGAQAGIRQKLDPKKNHRITLGLDYEYEPFSTKTLGFPEEDDTGTGLQRNLVQPIHIIAGRASRRIKWGKLVTTTLDLRGDGWWPEYHPHQRWSLRMAPGIRIGRTRGLYGELESDLFYKKFPNYFIADRHIDQEGAITTGRLGYNVGKLARLTSGFTFDFTHYLDARYNELAPDGNFLRASQSKNYLVYIPFAEFQLRPAKGLRIRGRYAFERQKTQHYNRVMTGRDEFASLTPKFFVGYYDYRRHRASLRLSWDWRDRIQLAAMGEAWIRHFDVYEARTVDNFWTGELRLDAELEASADAAVRVGTLRRKRWAHDFFISLSAAHVSRTSNMKRQVSLATNFDITRVFLGFEVRGRSLR
ncbi:MAG: hypothetical protein KC420_17315, partial [Myxococcales bacterium]|nr:hypothetical protein [Myxococcales bacterium]